jgi:hypothetical protein
MALGLAEAGISRGYAATLDEAKAEIARAYALTQQAPPDG